MPGERQDPRREAYAEAGRPWFARLLLAGAAVYALVLLFGPTERWWQTPSRAAVVALLLWVRHRILVRAPASELLFQLCLVLICLQQILSVWLSPSAAQNGIVHYPAMGAVVTLLVGPVWGSALVAVPVAVLAAALATGRQGLPYAGNQLFNLVLMSALLQAFAFALRARLLAGAGALADTVGALRAARDDVEQLSRTLSGSLSHAVDELQQALSGRAPQAHAVVGQLTRELASARRGLPTERPVPPQDLDARLTELRQRMALLQTASFAFASLAGGVLLPFLGGPTQDVPVVQASFFLLAALLVAHRVRPGRWHTWAVATSLVTAALLTFTVARWLGRAPVFPPNAIALGGVAVSISAVVGPRLGLGLLGAGSGVLVTGLWLRGSPPAPSPLLGVAFAISYAFACALVARLPAELLLRLQADQEIARKGLRDRRRLVATLFHDLANPLMVLQSLLPRGGGAMPPEDELRAQAMVRRMRLVIDTALGGPAKAAALRVGDVFLETEQLFRERLTAKSLSLVVSGAVDERVLAAPALLRETVLGNAMSNAIKFAPRGTALELRAWRDGASVVVAVEDRGPGIPPEVREAVDQARQAPSRPGTEGEEGSGLGLMLASLEMAAMGGDLELCAREGGGSSVRLRLPAA